MLSTIAAASSRIRSLSVILTSMLLVFTMSACDLLFDRGQSGDAPPGLRKALRHPGTFAWLPVEGMTCRDGSSTGIGLRLQRPSGHGRGTSGLRHRISDDLVIFLEGGGACFNPATCQQNRSRFTRDDFFSEDFVGGYSGIFDDEHPDNPVADWNFAYVSYCTGDEHVGNDPHGVIPGVDADGDGQDDRQRFVGYDNVGAALDVLTTHLGTDFDRVLLTGSSAGGVGSLGHFDRVAQTFSRSEVTLLDDSGPVFYDDALLPVALQQTWVDRWNLTETFPDDALFEGEDVLANIYDYHAQTYPGAPTGLLSYEQDATIRFFYSFGVALEDQACFQKLYGGLAQDPPQRIPCISGPAYEEALYDLRAELPASWRTFYVGADGPAQEQHSFLRAERFYTATADDQPLSRWVEDLIEGAAANRGTQEEQAPVDAATAERPSSTLFE